jgi:hypothetical protein
MIVYQFHYTGVVYSAKFSSCGKGSLVIVQGQFVWLMSNVEDACFYLSRVCIYIIL